MITKSLQTDNPDNYPYDLDGIAYILVHLPERVKAEIDRRGLSLRAAANEIGTSHTNVHYVCTKKRDPSLSTVVKFICWLQISAHKES